MRHCKHPSTKGVNKPIYQQRPQTEMKAVVSLRLSASSWWTFCRIPLEAFIRKVADVWEKDVWEFQAKSGSSGSCRLFLHFLGKIAVRKMSGRTPGSPRHPSSRHPRPSDSKVPQNSEGERGSPDPSFQDRLLPSHARKPLRLGGPPLEGPTRKPRHTSVFSTHSDTQAVPHSTVYECL